jgi:hypothetical protein
MTLNLCQMHVLGRSGCDQQQHVDDIQVNQHRAQDFDE